ncbi:MAG: Rrf2 family transcriptional regulator [bacterium]|nr:Rrf2 family transcriptional regulator [bacterium]
MKLSTKGRYGLRAILELALSGEGACLSINDIAQKQGISFPYVEQLMVKLRKAGLVESIRGPNGGYYLCKPAAEIKASEVLRIVEGPIEIVHCAGLKKDAEECKRAGECATQLLWTKVSQQMARLLDGISLEELAKWEKELKEKKICKQGSEHR